MCHSLHDQVDTEPSCEESVSIISACWNEAPHFEWKTPESSIALCRHWVFGRTSLRLSMSCSTGEVPEAAGITGVCIVLVAGRWRWLVAHAH